MMKLLVLTSQVFQLGGAEKLSLELVYGINKSNIKSDLGIVFKSPNLENTNADIIESFENKPGDWFYLDYISQLFLFGKILSHLKNS